MKSVKRMVTRAALAACVAGAMVIAGCNTMHESNGSMGSGGSMSSMGTTSSGGSKPAPAPAMNTTPAKASTPVMTTPVAAKNAIRIKLGADSDYKDPKGNVWKAAGDAADGSTTTRDDSLAIAGTDDPGLYHSECYDITKFSYKVPNGKYTVKMYFAETWTDASGGDISGPGGRVFSFKVDDLPEVKDFDIAKEAGAVQKAVVKTFEHANVTNGMLTITFTPGAVQSTECNAIEIIPE